MRATSGLLWFTGLIAAVWGLAVYFETGRIEADLGARATLMLRRTGLGWARPKIAGRDVIVTGTAPHEGAVMEAVNLLYGVWGVRGVTDQVAVQPPITPFTFKARRGGGAVNIEGYVETEEDRARLHERIARVFPGIEIGWRISLGAGQPAGWMAAAVFAAVQLEYLQQGVVVIEDRAISISGTAPTQQALDALARRIKSDLPPGYTLKHNGVVQHLPAPAGR